MLSTEQKKQRDQNTKTAVLAKSATGFQVRQLSGKYDLDRVTELWANLTMIQQMQGNDNWLRQSKESKLGWNDFVEKLIKSRGTRVIVFENQEVIFGFAYMQLESMHLNNPKKKTALKAVISEMYLEPAFRKKTNHDELGDLMKSCVKQMGIEYVEIAIEDLI